MWNLKLLENFRMFCSQSLQNMAIKVKILNIFITVSSETLSWSSGTSSVMLISINYDADPLHVA